MRNSFHVGILFLVMMFCQMIVVYDVSALTGEQVEKLKKKSSQVPEDKSILEVLSDYYYKRKNYKEAILYLQKLVDLEPQTMKYRIILGGCLKELGLYRAAKEQYQIVLFAEEKNKTALLELSHILEYENNLEEAKSFLKQVVIYFPDTALAYSALGRISLKMGKLALARSYFEKSMKLNPEDVDSLLGIANLHIRNEEYDSAIEILSVLKTKYPYKHGILHSLAKIYLNMNQFEEAQKQYEKIIKIKKNDVKAFYSLGVIAYKQNNLSDAVHYLNQAIASNDAYSEPVVMLLQIMLEKKMYKQVFLLAKEKIRLFPKVKDILYSWEIAAEYLGQFHEVELFYENLQLLYPKDVEIAERIAYVYIKTNKLKRARDVLVNIIREEKNISHPEVFSNLSYIYAEEGDYDQSIRFAQKALSIQSDYLPAYEHLAYALSKKGKFTSAVDVYNRILKLDKFNASASTYKGILLYEIHSYQESFIELKETLRYHNTPVIVYYYLGNIYRNFIKNKKKAILCHVKYLRLLKKHGSIDDIQLFKQELKKINS